MLEASGAGIPDSLVTLDFLDSLMEPVGLSPEKYM